MRGRVGALMGKHTPDERKLIAAFIAANGVTECPPGRAWKLGKLDLVNGKFRRRVLPKREWVGGSNGREVMAGSQNGPARPDWLPLFRSRAKEAPYLGVEEERDLIERWQTRQDREARDRLLAAHSRQVISMAYKHWGADIHDLIQAGNLGLMEAANKYDRKRGARFATHAQFWIRRRIFEQLERYQSAVKFATTSARKKLFYGLPRMKADLGIDDGAPMSPEDIERIAKRWDLPKRDIEAAELWRDGGNGELLELPGKEPSPEDIACERGYQSFAESIITSALNKLSAAGRLNDRDRAILVSRDLTDSPLTLAALGSQYGISRERVRQIHCAAREKLKRAARGLLFQKVNVPTQ